MCTFITFKSAHKGGNGNNCQPLYREYMKGEEGVWGRYPPEANGMKRSKIKWKLLLFDDGGWGRGGLVVNTSDSRSRVAVLCP